MRPKLFLLIFSLWSSITLTSCVPIPYPPTNLSDEEITRLGQYHVGKKEAKKLLKESASRKKVIETLGRPLRYRADNITYNTCHWKGGIGLIVPYPWPMPIYESGGDKKCYALIFSFDSDNNLIKMHETSESMAINEKEEDMALRKFGLEGDRIAQSLWLESRSYYKDYYPEDLKQRAESGDKDAQWEIYLLQPNAEHVGWLCCSADQGNSLARKELGNLYLYGTEKYRDIKGMRILPDLPRSCMWFHLAGLTEITARTEAESVDKAVILHETVELKRTARVMSPIQMTNAHRLIASYRPGRCMHDIIEHKSSDNFNYSVYQDLCEAADMGDFSSRDQLGMTYFVGSSGIKEDLPYAYMWYYLAAMSHPDSMYSAQKICDSMSRNERSIVLRMLDDWAPGICQQHLLKQ